MDQHAPVSWSRRLLCWLELHAIDEDKAEHVRGTPGYGLVAPCAYCGAKFVAMCDDFDGLDYWRRLP